MSMAPSSRPASRRSLWASLDRARLWRRSLLPVSLLLQCFAPLARHVILVMLGEHGVRHKGSSRLDASLGANALPFAKQVWHDTAVANRNVLVAIGHLKTELQIVAALQAADLHHAAEANARAYRGLFLGDVGRRIEKHDRLPHGVEHQRHREGQHAET